MAIIISGLSNDILVNGSSVVTEAEAIGLAPTTNPTFTGTVTLPSTTSIGAVSSTELGYLDGVTSNIQTQLDAKLIASAMSLSANGYLKLSNGLIVQWGQSTGTASGTAITLPIAFPNAIFGVYGNFYTTTANLYGLTFQSSLSTITPCHSGYSSVPFRWFAIGY